jgi:hypothetical protein
MESGTPLERCCVGAVAGRSIAMPTAFRQYSVNIPMTAQRRRTELVLSTAKIEDFDRWWNAFSTKGAEKRKQHGSKGSHVFRDPDDDRRMLVVFDWDEEGFRNFVSDPEMVEVFEVGGIEGKPQAAEFVREHDA